MATHGFPGISGYYTCDHDGQITERVFTDSWTGKDLCFDCAHAAAYYTTQSPQEEGDNIEEVLVKHCGEKASS